MALERQRQGVGAAKWFFGWSWQSHPTQSVIGARLPAKAISEVSVQRLCQANKLCEDALSIGCALTVAEPQAGFILITLMISSMLMMGFLAVQLH